MNGDDGDVGVGISSLKREVYFQSILVVGRHRRNSCVVVKEEQIVESQVIRFCSFLDNVMKHFQAI